MAGRDGAPSTPDTRRTLTSPVRSTARSLPDVTARIKAGFEMRIAGRGDPMLARPQEGIELSYGDGSALRM